MAIFKDYDAIVKCNIHFFINLILAFVSLFIVIICCGQMTYVKEHIYSMLTVHSLSKFDQTRATMTTYEDSC